MRKIIVISFVIFTSLLLSGCQEKVSVNEKNEQLSNASNSIDVLEETPDIVFMYSYHYDHERFKKCVFDKDGNIYYSQEEEILYLNYKDLLELYASDELKNKLELIGTIDTSELDKYFQLFLEIMRDGGVQLTSEGYVIEMVVPEENWSAFYYDNTSNIAATLLYRKDAGFHHTNDARADEIVQWMNEIIKKYEPSSS